MLVSGQITGEAVPLASLEAVKAALSDTPVLANTGVTHDTVADVLSVADGCIVGSSLKVDGDTWNPVDAHRAKDFMDKARAARGDKWTGRGRYSGKHIKILAKENPRRKYTYGWKSWNKLQDGMLYDDAIKAGARPQDIAWDIKHENLAIK